jgi:choline dehydrogenase-like flavoprotein
MDAYDYVVVGSGPGGATVARYLSDDAKNSVLLLESGEDKDELEIIRDSSFAPTLEERVAQLFYSVPQLPNDMSEGDDAYIQGEWGPRPLRALVSVRGGLDLASRPRALGGGEATVWGPLVRAFANKTCISRVRSPLGAVLSSPPPGPPGWP